jgi:hypothetical protein
MVRNLMAPRLPEWLLPCGKRGKLSGGQFDGAHAAGVIADASLDGRY